MKDPYDLNRFLTAQNPDYVDVCNELRSGQKLGHWMWYIFPQIKGLGGSDMSLRFAITSRKEAEAYLAHPVLGSRLRECTQLVMNCGQHSIDKIFDWPDNLKFRSCMTLFAKVDKGDGLFVQALKRFFSGEFDSLTLKKLGNG
jgi:uncharacterized protein (DUF1810 family)